MWTRAYNKTSIAILIGFFVVFLVLGNLRPWTGPEIYAVGLGALLIVVIPLIFWQARQSFPADGAGSTKEKTISLNASAETVFNETLHAMKELGWRVIEANSDAGQVKAKVRRSVNTLYGQLVVVDVKGDKTLANVSVRCSTLYQASDYGRNKVMLDRFTDSLQKKVPTSPGAS